MFSFFGGASLKIAKNLIRVTGLEESLAVFQKNNFSNIGEGEVLKLLLASDACNLLQTMKEEFISREISEEDLQDTVEDYVVENLKAQTVIVCRDGAERMEQCQEILGVAAKFQEYWSREDTKDPGPRFYCVKELLRRLGCEANTPIHDNLFEFVYEQHNRFNRYFRTLLEPFRKEDAPEPLHETLPSAVSLHNPSVEAEPAPLLNQPQEEPEIKRTMAESDISHVPSLDTLFADPVPEPLPEEEEAREAVEELPQMLEDLPGSTHSQPLPAAPAGLVLAESPARVFEPGEISEEDDLLLEERAPVPAKPRGLEDLDPAPSENLLMENPPKPSKPTSKMLEDLFEKVNPINDESPGKK